MDPNLIVDAFGSFTPIPQRVAPDPEFMPDPENPLDGYLWSVFRTRSELMRWSIDERSGPSHLWNVYEAELTYHLGGSQIGFAQVGLEVQPATPLISPALMIVEGPPPGVDPSQGHWAAAPMRDDGGPPTNPVVAISPLIQCLEDSLRWFGEPEVSAYQVTGYDLLPNPDERFLRSLLGWFRNVLPDAVTPALLTLASTQPDDRLLADVLAGIEDSGFDFFKMGPLVDAPTEHAASRDWNRRRMTGSEAGITVTLPEWSTAACGWLLARVFEVALALEAAPQDLSLRLTRTAPQ